MHQPPCTTACPRRREDPPRSLFPKHQSRSSLSSCSLPSIRAMQPLCQSPAAAGNEAGLVQNKSSCL